MAERKQPDNPPTRTNADVIRHGGDGIKSDQPVERVVVGGTKLSPDDARRRDIIGSND